MSHPQHPNDSAQSPIARRSDAGKIRLQPRDVDGLVLLAEQYAAPYDLLAHRLGVTDDRLRGITARWRDAGLAATGRLAQGPAWCWLTPAGMRQVGHNWAADPPPPPRRGNLVHRSRADPQGQHAHPADHLRTARRTLHPGSLPVRARRASRRHPRRRQVPARAGRPHAHQRTAPRRPHAASRLMWMPSAQARDRRDPDPNRERDNAAAAAMLAAAALLAVLWPLGIAAAATITAAWLTGAHPARLARTALASLPMTAVYIAAATIHRWFHSPTPFSMRRSAAWSAGFMPLD